ncbi:MAG: preprotein translocase subunit SecE [bacterium]
MADTLVTTQAAPERKSVKDRVVGFFADVNKEMKKVTWPSRESLIDATIVTLALCAIFSVFVFGVDKIFEVVLRLVYSI